MENGHAYDHFRSEVHPALVSKLEEFHVLGYDSVSENELWKFLTRKKWKKTKGDIHIYEIIEDVLAVKVSDFISFTTIESYKTAEFSLDDENELKELLK
ncbi:post-transcriptional regulator [Neobacillus mesonae]|uniref:post-transcriptional regulator n=1 Tax=Neobacillus mesonae TaxID=1193713 RepID=UPI00203F17BC|nr:post-transcriptional regulator [Neobacillus mesonae]MCM3568429.1 post-transcriptional regulator [Neobacillus mesonae]